MRYHPVYLRAKELLESGIIGQVMQIIWLQPINILHFVKSYVRHPEWRMKESSGPTSLTKMCHDLDLMLWLTGSLGVRVLFSHGSRAYFDVKNKPATAKDAKLCSECPIKDECRFSAQLNYGEGKRYRKFVTNKKNPTKEQAIEDLCGGPYDQCAWGNGANVMAEYNTISELTTNDGEKIIANVIGSAYHDDVCWRTATIIGVNGRIEINESKQTVTLVKGTHADLTPGETIVFDCHGDLPATTNMKTHSGADYYFMRDVTSGVLRTDVEGSLLSHIWAFEIDDKRLSPAVQ
jgi:hypothetical protein